MHNERIPIGKMAQMNRVSISADGPLRWAAGPVQPGAAVVLLLVLPAAPAGAGAAGPYIRAALTLPRSVLYRKAACGEKTLHP